MPTMPTIPSYGNPVLMSASPNDTIQLQNYPTGGGGNPCSIIGYGGNFWQILQYNQVNTPVQIFAYKSTDGGATWAQIDAAHGPTCGGAYSSNCSGLWFDGVHTITVAWTASRNYGTAQPIQLQDFNLSTGLWGAVYGSGSANVYYINQLFKRPDGSVVVIAQTSAPSTIEVTANVLASGAWTQYSLDTSFPGGWGATGWNGPTAASMDSTGLIHMFAVVHELTFAYYAFYQQFTTGNATANLQNLTATLGTGNFNSTANPVFFGAYICYGVTNPSATYATMIAGTPISNPTFSMVASPGINPAQVIPSTDGGHLQPALATDGTNLWAVFTQQHEVGIVFHNQVWLSATSNTNPTTGWNGALIYDDQVGSVRLPTIQYPTISVIGSPILTVQANDPGPDETTTYSIFPSLSISCSSPPNGTKGVFYTHTFPASGGVTPYTFSIASGSLPLGLTLNTATGVVSGTPTAIGVSSFVIQVTDAASSTATASCSITITVPTATISCSITITVPFRANCGTATGGGVGTTYTQTMAKVGGVGPYTWTILSGTIPPGTTLTASTGVITGTLTTPGRFFWTAQVTDSTGNFAIVSCFAQICPS